MFTIFFYSISAHRLILAAASRYFDALFNTPMKEKSEPEIAFDDISGEELESIVEYCYTGKLEIRNDNVDAIVAAGIRFGIDGIQKMCIRFYANMMTPSNCLGICMLAEQFNLNRLKEKALLFVLNRFMEVSESREFLLLGLTQLTTLLNNNHLKIANEGDVFNAMINWIQHDLEIRKSHCENLINVIRFQHVSDTVRVLAETEITCQSFYGSRVLFSVFGSGSSQCLPQYQFARAVSKNISSETSSTSEPNGRCENANGREGTR